MGRLKIKGCCFFAILVFLFILTRFFAVLFSEKITFLGAECYAGAVTDNILNFKGISPWELYLRDYTGGTVANGFLLVPFFLLFGQYVISLKLAAVFLSLVGFVFYLVVLYENFGKVSALYGGILYVFCPPILTGANILFSEPPAQSIVLSIFLLFTFFRYLDKRNKLNLFLFGMISGFSLWYYYVNAVVILSCLTVWAISGKRGRLIKEGAVYLLGFLIMLFPWFVFNVNNEFSGLRPFQKNYIGLIASGEFYQKITRVLFDDSYRIFGFDEFSYAGGMFFNVLYFIVFLLAIAFNSCYFLRHFRNGTDHRDYKGERNMFLKQAVIILIFFIFLLLYAFSHYEFEKVSITVLNKYRYIFFLMPFIIMNIALFLGKLYIAKGRINRTVSIVILCMLIFMAVVGNARFFYSAGFDNGYLKEPAANYNLIGYAAFRKYGLDIDKAAEMIEKLDNIYKMQEAYKGYGEIIGKKNGVDGLRGILSLGKNIDNDLCRSWYFFGLGFGAMRSQLPFAEHKLEYVFNNIDSYELGQEEKSNIVSGALTVISFSEKSSLNLSRRTVKIIQPKYRNQAVFFYGARTGYMNCRNKRTEAHISNVCIDEKDKRNFYIGVGTAVSWFFSANTKKIEKSFLIYPEQVRGYLSLGKDFYLRIINDAQENALNLEIEKYIEQYLNT